MNRGRVLVGAWVVLMVAVASGAGIKIAAELSRLEEAGRSLDEQQAIQRAVAEEREAFREKIDRLGKEMRAARDSLEKQTQVHAFDASFDLAKVEGILDQRERRAQKRIEFLEKKKNASWGWIVRWGVAACIAEIALGASAYLLLRRGKDDGGRPE